MHVVDTWTMASAAQQDEQRILLISGQSFGLDLLVENLGEAQACVVTTAAKALPDPLDYVGDIEELESVGISCPILAPVRAVTTRRRSSLLSLLSGRPPGQLFISVPAERFDEE